VSGVAVGGGTGGAWLAGTSLLFLLLGGIGVALLDGTIDENCFCCGFDGCGGCCGGVGDGDLIRGGCMMGAGENAQ
jgi:hypothetical protein